MRVIKVNKKRGNIVLSRKVAPRRGERREEEAHARDARRGQGPPRRRQEHHRLRRLHRPRRHRRPAAHHRHVVGPRRPPVGALQGQRRDRRDRAQVRPGDRARLARPQAAHGRSVDDRRPTGTRSARASSGKVVSLTDYGAFVELEPGVEGLIHVSEMSWSKRVKHPSKILNVGDTVEAMVLGVDPAGAAHLARPQAGREQPVARAGREVPGRLEDHRQGAQPDRVRRVRRGRGGHRRPDPHLRHVVEQAGQAPVRGAEEGRHGRGDGAQHRRREPAPVARPEAARDRHLGRLLLAATRSATWSRARSSA